MLRPQPHNRLLTHALSLDFIPHPVRTVAPLCGLVLCRLTNTTALELAICNPFTRQYRALPVLNIVRTNPAVGLIELGPGTNVTIHQFRVYVSGGVSEVPRGGASYEATLEIYDSRYETWQIIGPMPMEFAVRLTVWTPMRVYSNGVLYWMTSARAYSVMGFDIGSNTRRELSVPMAERHEFATLVGRNGNLTLVGGTCGCNALIWELCDGDFWVSIGKVPIELGVRFLGDKESWESTKCVGIDGVVCLYRNLGSGMVVWREDLVKGLWEWVWVDGCCSIRGKEVKNLPIKGVAIQPNLDPSYMSSIKLLRSNSVKN